MGKDTADADAQEQKRKALEEQIKEGAKKKIAESSEMVRCHFHMRKRKKWQALTDTHPNTDRNG